MEGGELDPAAEGTTSSSFSFNLDESMRLILTLIVLLKTQSSSLVGFMPTYREKAGIPLVPSSYLGTKVQATGNLKATVPFEPDSTFLDRQSPPWHLVFSVTPVFYCQGYNRSGDQSGFLLPLLRRHI